LKTRIAVRPRDGILAIPAEARRAFRLDLLVVRVEVILRDHELMLLSLAPCCLHIANLVASRDFCAGEAAVLPAASRNTRE